MVTLLTRDPLRLHFPTQFFLPSQIASRVVRAFFCMLLFSVFAGSAFALQSTPDLIQSNLNAGEFPVAIKRIEALPKTEADHWRGQLALAQANSGSRNAAFQTAATITSDLARSELLRSLSNSNQTSNQNPNRNPSPGGRLGGVTIQDFGPLINLLTNTIATDSWEQTGGVGTLMPYPAGVFVDPSGTLKKIKTDPQLGGRANVESRRSSLIAGSGNRQPQLHSPLRKISLTRLERAAQLNAAQGLPIDSTMANLAGLIEIQFVVVVPESGEIIIAGPAGPWETDQTGRAVNTKTGQPVMQLDDWVVCLRNAYQHRGQFGCSINPRPINLLETKTFLANSLQKGAAWSRGLQIALGQQDIEVAGIDPRTHAARILVEADYHMKLIGMGLEPSIAEVPSYLARVELNPDGTAPDLEVARWWFTLNEASITCDPARTIFSFADCCVRVLSENELLNERGQRIHTGQSSGYTKAFAVDFTKHYAKLARRYPIYRELNNVFSLSLAANLILQQELDQQADCHWTFFGPPTSAMDLKSPESVAIKSASSSRDQFRYRVKTATIPKCVDSVMNERILKFRKQSSTIEHRLVGVSGGIEFDGLQFVSANTVEVSDSDELSHAMTSSAIPEGERNWWWD